MSEESRSKVWTNYQEALAARSFVFNLDLSNQGLKKIEETVVQLNKIHTCNLSGNDLEDLPEEFFELHHCTSLDMSNNRFEKIPPLLTTFLDLKHLNIRGNCIPNAREQAAKLTELLGCEVVY